MRNENNHYYNGKGQVRSDHSVAKIQFVNPYNFVPLAGSVPYREEENGRNAEGGEELLTGRIDYTLTTLTPLFIPNTSNDRIFGIRSTDEKAEDEKDYHKNYDFFSYNDLSGAGNKPDNKGKYYEPVIPGSEIRGAVRSIYEALTDSCLPTMQKPSVIARRTPETYKAGVLEWNGKNIVLREDSAAASNGIPKNDLLYRDPEDKYNNQFPAKVKSEGFHDGDMVYFARKPRAAGERGRGLVADISRERTDTCQEQGWIMIGMEGPDSLSPKQRKHCVHIFTLGQKKVLLSGADNTELIKDNLLGCLKAYQENNPDAYKDYKKNVTDFFDHKLDRLPVYYSRIEGQNDGKDHYYWSPACITREVYYNKLDQCVKGYAACDDTQQLCPACSLFGMLNQNTGVGRGSRIRFSDAHLTDAAREEFSKDSKSCYEKIVTLPELATPKIQSTEFYLQRPQTAGRLMTWTYDYYIYLNDHNVPQIHWYTGKSDDVPVIAGRKFYWHSRNAYEENVVKRQDALNTDKIDDLEGVSKGRTIRNQTVRPVKSGVSFSGQLYFNAVTRTELDRLIVIMNMSAKGDMNPDGPHYAIKLGTGKPIGMGSIDLKIDKVVCRKVSLSTGYTEPESDGKMEAGYKELEYDRKSLKGFDESLFQDLTVLKYLDYNALGDTETAGYPGTENWPREGAEGFQWFMNNRRGFKPVKGGNGAVDTDSLNKSPNSRGQIHFERYMQSGSPQTVKNSLDVPELYRQDMTAGSGVITDTSNSDNTNIREQHKNDEHPAAVISGTARMTNKYKKGDERVGTVTANKDNNLTIRLDGSRDTIHVKLRFVTIAGFDKKHAKEQIPVNSRVKVRITAVTDGRPQWECFELF